MAPIPLLLAVFGFCCFVLAAIPVAEPHRGRLIPLGLAAWILILVLGYSGVALR